MKTYNVLLLEFVAINEVIKVSLRLTVIATSSFD